MLEETEVQVTLGGILEALDSVNRLDEMSRNQPYQNRIMRDWRQAFLGLGQEAPVYKYVRAVQESIRKMPKYRMLDMELLEVFYAIISQKPIREVQDDQEQTLRLSILSSVLEAFSGVYGSYLMADGNNEGELSIHWKRDFYYSFLDLLISEGLNEFENIDESFPKGRLPIMTFHQAKGLEFPFVFVGSLDVTPDSTRCKAQSKEFALEDLLKPWRTSLGSHGLPPFDAFERAEQDTIRLYYVAYSRAKEALVLLQHETKSSERLVTIDEEMQSVLVKL